jgi:pyridoxine/pyridoxamine 5'-phosphate oxidase
MPSKLVYSAKAGQILDEMMLSAFRGTSLEVTSAEDRAAIAALITGSVGSVSGPVQKQTVKDPMAEITDAEDMAAPDPVSNEALDKIWELLDSGTVSGRPFNLLQLATVNETGAPEVRTIVLRQFDRKVPALFFVTDGRSSKAREIARDSRVALVGYDPISRKQLRLTGFASSVVDETARAVQWSRLSEQTQQTFDSPVAPSTAIQAGGQVVGVTDDGMTRYERYSLIRADLISIESLDISQAPHRRMWFWHAGGRWVGERQMP